MSISTLRTLIDGATEYPPSEDLWLQIVNLATKNKELGKFLGIQKKMRHEVDQYKPSLPEPTLARIFIKGEYYYLDAKNNIYKSDPGNPLVGNLIGHIETSPNDSNMHVMINKEEVCLIKSIEVKEDIKYDKHFYIDSKKEVYRGLHPKLKYVYSIGKLNSEGKIELH